MYCSECGKQASGKFCWNCGRPLLAAEAEGHDPQAPQPATPSPPPADWSQELRYEVLLQIPEVRDQIAYHAAHAERRLSGEEFLELCDKALGTLTGGVPLSKVAALAQPLYARLGIGTGQSRAAVVPMPIGTVLVNVLCALAHSGQKVIRVQQGTDGCVLEAILPSDMWSFAGDLVIHVQREAAGTRIEAATKIRGQLFDWGKSRRCLDGLFQNLYQLPRAG